MPPREHIQKLTIVFSPRETRFYVRHKDSHKNDSEKSIIRIYDIVDQQVVFVKEFEVDDANSNFRFLNDNEMIYIKNPTPEEKWINRKYLVRLDLETMESTPFF